MLSYEYLISLYSADYDEILDKFKDEPCFDIEEDKILAIDVTGSDAFDAIYDSVTNHMEEVLYRLLYGTRGRERDFRAYFDGTIGKVMCRNIPYLSSSYIDCFFELMSEIKNFHSALSYERDGEDLFIDITGGSSSIALKFENKIYDDLNKLTLLD